MSSAQPPTTTMGPDNDQEDDDLELGFTNTLAEPSEPPAPAPAASAPAAPTPPAPAPDKDAAPASPAADAKTEPNVDSDPFKGVSPAVRDMLGDYQRLKTQFDEVRRVAGMVPGLQRELDKLKSAVAPPPPKADAPRRFEKVDKLREEGLDDIAAALEEIGAAIPQPSPPPPPPAPASTEDDVGAKLDSVRPTWQKDLTSGEFLLWLSQQPGGFQNEMRTTGDPDAIVKGLTKFDEFVANTRRPSAPAAPGPRTQRLAAVAATPRGVGRAPIRQVVDDEEADMEAGLTGRATYQHTR